MILKVLKKGAILPFFVEIFENAKSRKGYMQNWQYQKESKI